MTRFCLFATVLCMATNSCFADEQKSDTPKKKPEVENVVVGKAAPDFTATGIDGETFKLSEKLKDGKSNVALMFSRANW